MNEKSFGRWKIAIPQNAEIGRLAATDRFDRRCTHTTARVAAAAQRPVRTARNRLIDKGRKQREEPLPTAVDDADSLVCEVTGFLLDESPSPELELLRATVWEEVTAAVDELPAAQREAFWMTEVEGFGFRELSEITGIPVATLLTRKHRAVKYLRRRLADLYAALLED